MSSSTAEPPSELSPSAGTRERNAPRPGITRAQLAVVALLSLAFCWLTWLPLPVFPVWGEILRGSELWSRGGLPIAETLMPLARGMPFVQTGWGTDLILLAASSGGYAALKLLFSMTVIVAAWGVYRRSLSLETARTAALFAPACLISLVVSSSGIYDGVCLGMLCLVTVELLMAGERRGRFLLIPAVFAVWANLHPSFLIGLLWLAATLLAEWFAALGTAGKPVEGQQRRISIRELALILELSAVATLVNPYGPWLYPAAWNQLANSRLEALGMGGALSIRSLTGMLGAAFALFTIVYTLRRSDSSQQWRLLPITAVGFTAAWNAQIVPIWAISLSIAFAQSVTLLALRNDVRQSETPESSGMNDKGHKINLAIAALLIWIGFSFSAVGAAWFSSGKSVEPRSQLADDVPIGAAAWLREHPPRGLVFNPALWGDYLRLFGPRDLQVFATSAVDRLPASVWAEYQAIATGLGGADGLLDRYGIDTVVLDLRKSPALAEELRGTRVWRPVYRDDRSMILERQTSTR